MYDPIPAHLVAAAGDRHPQVLSRLDGVTRRGYAVDPRDLLVRRQLREDFPGDVVEVVPGLHRVDRDPVGDPRAVGAQARDRDPDLLLRRNVLGGVGGEVVGAQEVVELLDAEEGFDGGVGGLVGRNVVHQRRARGLHAAVEGG